MKNQKGFIQTYILLAIIGGIVVAGGVGYFGFNKYKQYKSLKIENEQLAQNNKTKDSTEIENLKKEVEELKKKPQNNSTKSNKPKKCASTWAELNEQAKLESQGIFNYFSFEECKNRPSISQTQEQKSLENKTTTPNDQIVSTYAKLVVRIVCANGSNGAVTGGSGVLFGLNRHILTNSHVVENANACQVGITDDVKIPPQRWFDATIANNISSLDIATLQLTNPPYFSLFDQSLLKGVSFLVVDPPQLSTIVGVCSSEDIKLGDPIAVLGYPTLGGNTITVTEGVISGFDGFRIKTSAKLEYGNSGGGAFLKKTGKSCWFGIPTSVAQGELESLGSIINYSLIHEQSQH